MKNYFLAAVFALFGICPEFALGAAPALDALSRAAGDDAVLAASPAPAPRPAAESAKPPALPLAKKEWTVMIFANGSRDQFDYLKKDLEAMSAVGTTAKINVLLEVGLPQTSTSTIVQRMLVLRSDDTAPKGAIYKEWKSRDMGDWRNMAEFVKWAKTNFPAKRFMFIISAHGTGFLDLSFPTSHTKGLSSDEITGNYMKIPQLKSLFGETGHVDIFLQEACLMQTAEVGYEIGDKVDLIMGSEELGLAYLGQYAEKLAYLDAHPRESLGKIAAAFAQMFRHALTPGSMITDPITGREPKYPSRTFSAVRGLELKNLPAKLDAWVKTVIAANEPEIISNALKTTVRFGSLCKTPMCNPNILPYTDLAWFIRQIGGTSENQGVRDASAELIKFIDNRLVVANGALNVNPAGIDYSKLSGIGIKMLSVQPTDAMLQGMGVKVDTEYGDLALSKDSQWDEFLNWIGKSYYPQR